MKSIRIFLIRHGRQSSSDCNVNVSLAPAGIRQAILTGERLKQYKIDVLYSSTLIRAVETADYIRKELGLYVTDQKYQIKEFREIDYGDLTGLTNEELKKSYCDYFMMRDKMEMDICIPGGENGEQVYNRMSFAMDKIIENAMNNKIKNIAVVSHGGAIRSYLAGILNIPQSMRFLIAKNLENCSVTELLFQPATKVITVERINDYSHIEEHDELLRKNFV